MRLSGVRRYGKISILKKLQGSVSLNFSISGRCFGYTSPKSFILRIMLTQQKKKKKTTTKKYTKEAINDVHKKQCGKMFTMSLIQQRKIRNLNVHQRQIG